MRTAAVVFVLCALFVSFSAVVVIANEEYSFSQKEKDALAKLVNQGVEPPDALAQRLGQILGGDEDPSSQKLASNGSLPGSNKPSSHSALAGDLIFTAVKTYSEFSGELVKAALGAGVDMKVVIIAATKAAPSRSRKIISAALQLFPELESEIVRYALGAGAPEDEVARAFAASRTHRLYVARGGGDDNNHGDHLDSEMEKTVMPSHGRGGVIPTEGDGDPISPH